jgi:hypothetical protein
MPEQMHITSVGLGRDRQGDRQRDNPPGRGDECGEEPEPHGNATRLRSLGRAD